MHAFIRSVVAEKYGQAVADETSILYGGSCNAGNADAIFSNPDVDGGLIGGASLKAADFFEIIKASKTLNKGRKALLVHKVIRFIRSVEAG